MITGYILTMRKRVTKEDLEELKKAKSLLENPGIAAKITNFIGKPIESGLKKLPDGWNAKIGDITQEALSQAAKAAIFTIDDKPGESSSNLLHQLAVFATGASGGFFGLKGLVVELPVTTTIMLRSIADIARSEGESISKNDVKLACLEVFALGGSPESDDGTETGYYTVRLALAQSISDAVKFLVSKKITDKGAPILVSLISKIAERFSLQITPKTASQLVPGIGAVSGAIINTIFLDHFQDMARGHFVVRRLERKYGKQLIFETYNKI